MREEANGYRDETISRAEGEADRFTKLVTEYRKAPEVTRQRLYLGNNARSVEQHQ